MVQFFVTLIENGTHFLYNQKKTSKSKFIQKLTAEILKRHERVPIDRSVAGLKHLFLNYFKKTEPYFVMN